MKAIAFVETTLFIFKNSSFQPGLWSRSQNVLNDGAGA